MSTFHMDPQDPSNLMESAELGVFESQLVKSSLRRVPLKVLQVSVPSKLIKGLPSPRRVFLLLIEPLLFQGRLSCSPPMLFELLFFT